MFKTIASWFSSVESKIKPIKEWDVIYSRPIIIRDGDWWMTTDRKLVRMYNIIKPPSGKELYWGYPLVPGGTYLSNARVMFERDKDKGLSSIHSRDQYILDQFVPDRCILSCLQQTFFGLNKSGGLLEGKVQQVLNTEEIDKHFQYFRI